MVAWLEGFPTAGEEATESQVHAPDSRGHWLHSPGGLVSLGVYRRKTVGSPRSAASGALLEEVATFCRTRGGD